MDKWPLTAWGLRLDDKDVRDDVGLHLGGKSLDFHADGCDKIALNRERVNMMKLLSFWTVLRGINNNNTSFNFKHMWQWFILSDFFFNTFVFTQHIIQCIITSKIITHFFRVSRSSYLTSYIYLIYKFIAQKKLKVLQEDFCNKMFINSITCSKFEIEIWKVQIMQEWQVVNLQRIQHNSWIADILSETSVLNSLKPTTNSS